MKIGIIGTGSMGSILIESFAASGEVLEEQLVVYNRSTLKTDALKQRFPDIRVACSATDVINQTEMTFLCVKPLQFPTVLEQIGSVCPSDHLLVSITSPIAVEQLEAKVNCKVARAIPSILNRAQSGPSLLSFGHRCTMNDRDILTNLMSVISTPLEIDENITRVSSDIVSCGPAFFSYLIQQFIDAAVRQTEISDENATALATDMLIGMGKLLEQKHYTLPSLQERVCVPGGITGEGIKVLEEEVGTMFDRLFQETQAKYEHERGKIESTMNAE